jgi:DNA modification methylase
VTDPSNIILHGNCIGLMAKQPANSVDFILTDPPYITNYQDTSGRTVINDDNAAWLKPAFAQAYRILKPDACMVSFYGWPKTDLFFAAWKAAGFRVAGHIVFNKPYASKSAFLEYHHEQAFLLLKGRPAIPEHPVPDVIDWKYTGNRLHPTQKPVSILKPLIAAFTRPGQIVLDPFAGSGSILAAAQILGRRFIGMDIDATHCATATRRLAVLAERRAA